MYRLLWWLELAFLATFWWQTRLPLAIVSPYFIPVSAASDYFIPYLYLNDVLFVAAVGLWLYLCRPWHRVRVQGEWWQQVWFWLGLFLVIAAVGVALGRTEMSGWWRWTKLIEAAMVGCWIADRWRNKVRIWGYGAALLGGLLFESLLMMGEFIWQRSLRLQWLGEWRFSVTTPGIAKAELFGREWLRGYGTFSHPNIAAAMLALGLGWIGVWWRKDWPKWLLVGCVLLLMGGLLVSFSRSAWLAGLFLGGWYVIYSYKKVSLSWRWGVVGLISIALITPVLYERVWSLWHSDQQSYLIREHLWQRAWLIWQNHQWLGVGLQGFILESMEYGPLSGGGYLRQPVHVVWVLMLVEVGVLGLLAWLGLFMASTWRLFKKTWMRRRKVGVVEWMLVGSWVAVFLLGMIDHYWWTSQPGLLVVGGLLGASWTVGSRQ